MRGGSTEEASVCDREDFPTVDERRHCTMQGRTTTLEDAAGNRDSKLCFRDDLEEGGTELARGRELVVDGGEDGVGDDSEGDAGISFFILKLKSKKQKNLSH